MDKCLICNKDCKCVSRHLKAHDIDILSYMEQYLDLKDGVCQCGCGCIIALQKRHMHAGVPKYIHGHCNRGKALLKGRILPEWHRHHIKDGLLKIHAEHPEIGQRISRKLKGRSKGVGRKLSEIHKQHISKSLTGHVKTDQHRSNLSKAHKGRIVTLESRKRHSETNKRLGIAPPSRKGIRPWNYMGRPKTLQGEIKSTDEYRFWRKSIFVRDEYTCQGCFSKGDKLHVHHTPKSFASILLEFNIKTVWDALKCRELWNVDNGQTLCKSCHEKTSNYFNGKR